MTKNQFKRYKQLKKKQKRNRTPYKFKDWVCEECEATLDGKEHWCPYCEEEQTLEKINKQGWRKS